MLTLPPEPSAKDPISATFVRALIRYIRANTLLNGTGYRTKRGPNGTTLDIRFKRAKPIAQSDNGRFAIKSIDGTTVTFKNPYYDADCKTYVSTSDTVTVSADNFTFVALQISKGTGGLPVATLVTYANFEAMSQAQKDFSKAVIPLYKFDKGAVECDFRTGPQVHAWEFSG